jgi:hypothetical protein
VIVDVVCLSPTLTSSAPDDHCALSAQLYEHKLIQPGIQVVVVES